MNLATRCLALCVLVCVVGPAAAQPTEPSKRDKARAKSLYSEATELHKAGSYDAAAAKYLAAFELVPQPLFLFNIGQVYRLAGDNKRAIEYYEQYLEMESNGKGSATAKKFLQELKSQMAKQPKPDEEPKKPPKEDGSDESNESVTTASNTTSAEVRADGRGGSGAVMVWTGLGLAVAGTASLAIGIKFGLDAKSLSDEISNNQDPWTEELLAKQSKGKSAETKALVFTSVGAAVLVGGGVLAYLGWRQKGSAEQGVSVAPVFSDDELGFAVSGSF